MKHYAGMSDDERALVTSLGNIRQRVFDHFPPFPATISRDALGRALPALQRREIEVAIRELYRAGTIERLGIGLYRLASPDVARPKDGRGRPPKARG